jgi:hypothetical protein
VTTALSSQPAEVHMTLQVTRAATGLTETVHLVGHVIPTPDDIPLETNDDHHPLDSSPQRGD